MAKRNPDLMSFSEIAATIGLSKSQVRRLYRSGMEKLEAALDAEGIDRDTFYLLIADRPGPQDVPLSAELPNSDAQDKTK